MEGDGACGVWWDVARARTTKIDHARTRRRVQARSDLFPALVGRDTDAVGGGVSDARSALWARAGIAVGPAASGRSSDYSPSSRCCSCPAAGVRGVAVAYPRRTVGADPRTTSLPGRWLRAQRRRERK